MANSDNIGRPPEQSPSGNISRSFGNTNVWIFDLDNTLYPADCNLFAQVDQRMGSFIAKFLQVPFHHARYLQKLYYRQYGTTLAGLMKIHNMEPQQFLDYVHDIDLAPVPKKPDLAAAIDALPGRKIIYTNGSRRHAERVAGKLGVLHLFEAITDIVSSDFIPKPDPKAYDLMLRRHNIVPETAAMFEDMPHNLEAPHNLGMATVLVHSSFFDHPVQRDIETWKTPPAHVHHMTNDLTQFLTSTTKTIRKSGESA